jgi:hypothetical protein
MKSHYCIGFSSIAISENAAKVLPAMRTNTEFAGQKTFIGNAGRIPR